MADSDTWQRALAQVFATYATDGAGISEDKLVKHTVKAAGKMGLPGTKHARTKQFHDYMAGARERKEYYLQDNIIFRNPVALAAAAAAAAAPAPANAAAASAPAPAQGSFAQMLQPAMGDAAAAPAAAGAGASDVAAAMGLQAAGANDTKPRQTLNDIATIATAQLTQHQGPAPASNPPVAPPMGIPVMEQPAQPAAAAAAPPPAVDDMHIDVVAPAPLPLAASLPPDMQMQTPHPLPPGDGGLASVTANGKKRGRPRQEGSWASDRQRTDVKRGKFSEKEKDIIRHAVKEYAAAHGHSQEDMQWLFKSRTTPGVYTAASGGAWQQIAKALPDRTTQQVWACGTRILHPYNYKGPWKPEEDEQLRALVEGKGNKWLEIGEAMGRMGEACRDRWRTIGLGSARKTGPWDEQEAAALTQEVQRYMELKQGARAQRAAVAGQVEDKRVVLDDIDWGAVAKAIGTRNHAQCMERWYKCQSPSMVERGVWGIGDDRAMLQRMVESRATQEWELDWGALVPDRTANQARRRWTLMLKHVDSVNDREFTERLLVLVEKYLPELREAAAANAAAAAQVAAPNPVPVQVPASEPQPAADAAAAVAAIPLGAMPAPEDVQLTIPPVDPLAADSVVVPIPDA